MPTYIRVKDLPNAATSPASDDFILLSGAANGARRISRADFLAAVAGFYTADPSAYKLATLDAGNKVLVSQLPSSAFSYQGTWAASTNTPTLADGTGTGGDTYYASDSGSVNFGSGSISFLAGDAVVYDGSVWQKVPDVVNLLDGKGTLDEAKTTLEIPDVGSNPDEVSLNGMLGSMAFQSAEGISVAKAEVESTTGTGSTQALTVTDGTNTHFSVDENGKTVIGPATTGRTLTVAMPDNSGGAVVVEEGSNEYLRINTTNGSESVVIPTGKVGIGTASPSSKLTIGEGGIELQGNKPNNVPVQSISWKNTNSSGFEVAKIQANTGANIYEGELHFITKDSGGTMATRWTINSTGNLVAGANLGIDFGSATTGTGTPSGGLLNDYEEGTWTPYLTFGGGGTGITYGERSGYYTKIGDRVFVSGVITLTAVGSSVGAASVQGLPFTASNASSSTRDNLTFSYASGMTGLGGSVVAIIITNQSYANLFEWAATGTTLVNNTEFTNSTSIRFNGQYHV